MRKRASCKRCIFEWACMESGRLYPCTEYKPKTKTEHRKRVTAQICAIHEFFEKGQEHEEKER